MGFDLVIMAQGISRFNDVVNLVGISAGVDRCQRKVNFVQI